MEVNVECEKCGCTKQSSEMIRSYDLLESKIVYECKEQSECFDMLMIIDDFCDINN